MQKLENKEGLLAIAQRCRLGGSMGLTVSFEAEAAVALAELLETLIELVESLQESNRNIQ